MRRDTSDTSVANEILIVVAKFPQCSSGSVQALRVPQLAYSTISKIMGKIGWWFGTVFIFPCIGNSHPN